MVVVVMLPPCPPVPVVMVLVCVVDVVVPPPAAPAPPPPAPKPSMTALPQNQLLLDVAGQCNQMAAKGKSRADAMREVARAVGSQALIPSECQ